jgi:hypothetical protein
MKTNWRWMVAVMTLALWLSVPAYGAKKSSGLLFGPTGMEGAASKGTIKVTGVQKGSPAEGQLKNGDQIIGVGSKKFGKDPKRDMAFAIDEAETKASGGKMTLMMKGGKNVTIKLPVLGSYSPTAPYNCAKSDKIITAAAEHLLKTVLGKNGSRLHPELLGLMATGEKKYIEAVAKEIKKADWAKPDPAEIELLLSGEKPQGSTGWSWGYHLITLSEYYLLTGDKSVLPAIKIYAVALAKGQDAAGLWGHRMASPKRYGRLPGYAQMNQSSMSCFLGMLLAKKCGVSDPAFEKGLKRTYDYVASHIGKGSFPYGVHGPNSSVFNNNGSSASAAICMDLAGNTEGAQFFSQLSATSYDGLEQGHASSFFNPMWTPLGANISGPEVTQQFLKKSLWFHNLRRNWDGSWSPDWKSGPHEGVALLTYCLPRHALYITGSQANKSIWLKGKDATAAVEISKMDYKSKSSKELMALAMDHHLPQVRRLASGTLVERRKELGATWIKYLKQGTPKQKSLAVSQYGWWIPLELRLPQIDAIGAILRDTKAPLNIRVAAAGSVAYMGEPAQKYYMDIIKLIALDKPDDIFGLIDGGLAKSANTLCKKPLPAGLVTDKALFYKVALKLADNKRQGARASGLSMLAEMPLEDFHLVADKVMHVINDQDETYHAYHNPGAAVTAGIGILADLNIKEGIDLALDIEKNPSGKHSFKMRATWAVLAKYGANAKEALKIYKVRSENRTNYGRLTGAYNAMVKAVEKDNNPKKLITLEEAKKAGK